MAQNDPYAEYAEVVIRKPTLKEESLQTNIRQGDASASSSAASAAKNALETAIIRETRPAAVREAGAKAQEAEAKAAEASIKLDKLRALASGRPMGSELEEATGLLLNTITNAVRARKLSRDMFSASGIGHDTLEGVSGTPAATMAGLIKNVGANTAFDRLQKMRENSPTGGALGQVAVQELELLKSSVGAIDPAMGDEDFQRGLGDVISHYINVYNKLGGDPYALAEALGPEEIDNFADKIVSARFLPEDESAIKAYVDKARAAGTFDPNDFASIMSQAYVAATGRKPDERYFESAYNTGLKLAEGKDVEIGGISYEQADTDLRQDLISRAKGAQPEGQDWGGALGDAAINFVPSTFELAYDTVKGLTVDGNMTLAGLLRTVGGATGLSDDEETYNAMKQYFIDRYGTEDGFQQAVRTDPASIVADVAGLFTGGATLAAKGLNTAGKVGRISQLSQAARGSEWMANMASKLDPVNMAADMTRFGGRTAAKVANTVGVELPARVAGVSGSEVKQAFDAGIRRSPEFREAFSGTMDPSDPVTQMEAALSDLYKRRSAQYQRRMAKLDKTEELPFDLIDDAISKVQSVGRHKGIDISGAAKVWDQIEEKVGEFNVPGQQLNTIEDYDAMKRAVFNIRDQYQLGTPEYKVANDVGKAIDSTIRQAAPEYAKIMGEYRIASDVLADVKASAGAGAASKDTILTKLRRTNAGTGLRGRTILDILESTPSGRGLGDRIAGMALSSDEPRGMVPPLAVGGAAVTQDPSALAALMLSPRRVGSTSYGLGEKYGMTDRARQSVMATAPAQKLSELATRYRTPSARALSVINPTVIQPQQDPFTYEQPDPEAIRAALEAKYTTPVPQLELDAIGAGPRLRDFYGQPETVDDLLARYRGQ